MPKLNVTSEVTGTVWKVLVKVGDTVKKDADLVILESMKMEIPVGAPLDAMVLDVLVSDGQSISEGDVVLVLDAGAY